MFTDLSTTHYVKQITSFSAGFCVINPAKKILELELFRHGFSGTKTVK